MAAPDYTAWPTVDDVINRLNRAGVAPREQFLTSDNIQTALDSLTDQVALCTRRQFIAGSPGETRFFDGSGSGELETDDFITLTQVTVLVVPMTTPSVVLNNAYAPQEYGQPMNRIRIQQGSVQNYAAAIFDHFPQGRGNIEVVATYGYGATIPVDVWDGVCNECAARLAQEAIFQPGGILVHGKQADVEKTWKLTAVKDGVNWTRGFCRILRDYERPTGRRARNYRAPVI